LDDALPDLPDSLLVRLAGVKTAELVGNFGSCLQPHGNLLICAHTDVLDVLGDGVGGLRAEIGDERNDDEDAGYQEPSTDTAATPAGYSSINHTFPS
jgi:hypothetical protein